MLHPTVVTRTRCDADSLRSHVAVGATGSLDPVLITLYGGCLARDCTALRPWCCPNDLISALDVSLSEERTVGLSPVLARGSTPNSELLVLSAVLLLSYIV